MHYLINSQHNVDIWSIWQMYFYNRSNMQQAYCIVYLFINKLDHILLKEHLIKHGILYS